MPFGCFSRQLSSVLIYLSLSILQDATLSYPEISLSRLTWGEGVEEQQKTRSSSKEEDDKEPNSVGLKLFFMLY